MPKLQGPLRLYNMFPRVFKDFVAMKEYVVKIAKMGFNAVWLNPLQEVTDLSVAREIFARNIIPIDEMVSGSLYAAKSFEKLNKEFIRYKKDDSEEEIQRKGEQQLKELIAEIKAYGMVPMFDLVLNHVAADSDLVKKYEDRGFFKKDEASSYQDVRDFNYAEHEDEIINEIWKGYIEKYTKKYGFEGVRVDAPFLFSLHKTPGVRGKIYKLLQQNVENPIIFEEWLYSGYDTKKMVQDLLLQDNFPTHVTTSLAYEEFARDNEEGEIVRETPPEYRNEVKEKERVIFVKPDDSLKEGQRGGVVNSSGNHDNFSLKGEVLRRLAVIEMYDNPDLEWLRDLFHSISHEMESLGTDVATKISEPYRNLLFMKEAIIFGLVKELHRHPEAFGLSEENIDNFLKERLAIVALTGGGGFVMLSGDESADLRDKPVFKSNYDLAPLDYDPKAEFGDLMEMFGEYADIQHPKDLPLTRKILKNIRDPRSQELQFCNFGLGPLSGKNDLRDFVVEINHILSKLPEGKFGHHSEILSLDDKPELVIIARTNGEKFKIADGKDPISRCDLVVVNISNQEVTLDDEDLRKIYMDFEKKVGAPFDGSYNHISKANLHLSLGIRNVSSKKELDLETTPRDVERGVASTLLPHSTEILRQ